MNYTCVNLSFKFFNIWSKELNVCHKLKFPISLQPDAVDLLYFQLLILSFKYQRFTPSCGKDIEIRKFEFLAKTQFLSEKYCLFVEFDKIIVFYLLSGYDPVEEFDW